MSKVFNLKKKYNFNAGGYLFSIIIKPLVLLCLLWFLTFAISTLQTIFSGKGEFLGLAGFIIFTLIILLPSLLFFILGRTYKIIFQEDRISCRKFLIYRKTIKLNDLKCVNFGYKYGADGPPTHIVFVDNREKKITFPLGLISVDFPLIDYLESEGQKMSGKEEAWLKKIQGEHRQDKTLSLDRFSKYNGQKFWWKVGGFYLKILILIFLVRYITEIIRSGGVPAHLRGLSVSNLGLLSFFGGLTFIFYTMGYFFNLNFLSEKIYLNYFYFYRKNIFYNDIVSIQKIYKYPNLYFIYTQKSHRPILVDIRFFHEKLEDIINIFKMIDNEFQG